jgi:hypothetical protein
MDFIRECIAIHGEQGAAVARVRYSHVPPATWHRWLKAVRSEANMPETATLVPTSAAVQAETELSSGPIDWQSQIRTMLAQCDLLVRQSVHIDPVTGAERVRNPVGLGQAIRTRCSVLELGGKREATLYDAARFDEQERRMVRVILTAIGTGIGEEGRAIILRIKDAIERECHRREVEHKFLGGVSALEATA